MFYITLPILLLSFWFFEAPRAILAYFGSLNSAFLHLFSLPLLVKTFFRPWKNEYRKGLIGFSVGMGMAIKTLVIFVDLLLFVALLTVEFCVIAGFLLMPILTVLLLFR